MPLIICVNSASLECQAVRIVGSGNMPLWLSLTPESKVRGYSTNTCSTDALAQ